MNEQPLEKREVFTSLPPDLSPSPLPAIRERLRASGRKVVILDDDPTGTQTTYDVPVLTEWSVASLTAELRNELSAFFILTNSRSLPLGEARDLNSDIGRHLVEASLRADRRFVVVSRGDSTLRGHFPGEVEALAEALGEERPTWLIAPFFEEGGRFTIGDAHYVAEGDRLIPAGLTPYARDSAFGYRSSNLREWVEEKTSGRIAAGDVASVGIEDIRCGGPERVADILLGVPRGAAAVANAASYRDMEVFTLGLLDAEARGARFLYRTAASFVRARVGLGARELLTRDELVSGASGGALVVAGSHVPKTNRQLEHLFNNLPIQSIELDVKKVLTDEERESEVARVASAAEDALSKGGNAAVFTSRGVIAGTDERDSLSIGRAVSRALTEVVNRIGASPRCIIAKGGVTSSVILTDALRVRRAMVLGQVVPGIPVWRLGEESRFPGMPYVSFPGNTGDDDALTRAVRALSP